MQPFSPFLHLWSRHCLSLVSFCLPLPYRQVNSTNIVYIEVYIGVALIFLIDAFIGMGCTELKAWMGIIIDLLTWKGYGRMLLFSLSWRVAETLIEELVL